MACAFGFVHGLGFAGVLNSMLYGSSILFPLFSFNIGIEIGQLMVVVTLLLVTNIIISFCSIKQTFLIGIVSTVIASLALIVAIGRLTDIFRH